MSQPASPSTSPGPPTSTGGDNGDGDKAHKASWEEVIEVAKRAHRPQLKVSPLASSSSSSSLLLKAVLLMKTLFAMVMINGWQTWSRDGFATTRSEDVEAITWVYKDPKATVGQAKIDVMHCRELSVSSDPYGLW